MAFKQHGRETKLTKLEEHVQLSQEPAISDGFDSETLPAAKGAYSSLRLHESAREKKKSQEIESLLAQGFIYVAAEDFGDTIK